MREFVIYFICVVISILLGISILHSSMFVSLILFLFLAIGFMKFKSCFKIKFLAIAFMIFALFNTINYYSLNEKMFSSVNFRIQKKIGNDLVVSNNFKKFIIKDFQNENFEDGLILNLSGKFKNSRYYDVGIVGEIKDFKINNFKSDFFHKFIRVKNVLKNYFVGEFGEKNGNILSGLILGDLDSEFKKEFKSLGIVHILSISGFHINLVFGFLSKLFSYLPSIIVLFLYLIFTGTKVSGIRAFTMIFLKEFSPRVYRTYDALNALFFSCTLILLMRPYEIFNLGFIYTFASTLGILMFNSKIRNYFYKIPSLIGDSLSILISAQIFILPLSILIERKLNLQFILSNILLIPFYTIIIILGFILIFASVVPIVREICIYLIKLNFDIIDGGIIFIKSLLPSEIYLSYGLITIIICFYVIYFMLFKIPYKIKRSLVVYLVLVGIYFNVSLSMTVEFGNYFGKNYVILRSENKSVVCVDKNLKNDVDIKSKLFVDKVLSGKNCREINFSGIKFSIDFKDDKVLFGFNDREVEFLNNQSEVKYYSNYHPQKYYFIF